MEGEEGLKNLNIRPPVEFKMNLEVYSDES